LPMHSHFHSQHVHVLSAQHVSGIMTFQTKTACEKKAEQDHSEQKELGQGQA